MSEPFSLKISAKKVSPEALQALSRFAAAVNSKDGSALRVLLADSSLAQSALTTDKLPPDIFLPHAPYTSYQFNVVDALYEASQATELTVMLDGAGKLRMKLEGTDRDADGFCVFFLVWLASVGLTAFDATAKSSHGWSAKWTQDAAKLTLVKHKLPGDENSAAVYAKRNAAAEKSSGGFLIKQFKYKLGGDFNRLVSSLTKDSVMTMPFSHIIDKLAALKRVKTDSHYSDHRFDLEMLSKTVLSPDQVESPHLGRINGFEIISINEQLGPWNFDYDTALAHVEQVITQPLHREVLGEAGTDEQYACLHWAVGDISAVLTLHPNRFSFRLQRFPDMTKLSVARIYALYEDGISPSAFHWKQLQTLAQEQAAQGDADALNILALLCFYNRHGLKRDKDKAEQLFIQAAERGSTAAMRELGRSYAHFDRLHKPWAKDMEKARHYMYLCEVKEFGSNAVVNIAESKLVFIDNYYIYNEDPNPLIEINFDPYNDELWCAYDGVWINTEDDNGVTIARRINIELQCFDREKKHLYQDGVVEINGFFYVVEGRREKTTIFSYDQNSKKISKKSMPWLRSALLEHMNFLYACDIEGNTYCFDLELNELWNAKKSKRVHSSNVCLSYLIGFDDLIIVNVGEDKTDARGNFEINAYKFDTGELVWQQIVETSPESNNLVGDKLYLSVNDRFIKIDAKTGKIELDVVFGYKTFDEQKGSVSVVYPVEQGLLCFNHQNHFIELRSHDATTILQTVKLPETYAYHLSVKPPVIEHEGKIYFALGHLVMGLNPMKSAIAVLTPDATAPANCEAQLEQRPPYTVESFKDEKGKNALRVRMGGNDAHKIMRYAHVVLKELAFRTGLTSFFEFETRDKKNARILELEIDTSELPTDKNKEQWLEHFGVLKTRVESELKTNDILAGDGKSNYQVTVSVV